ncbi:MAG: hypothetical protein UX31_C0009G0017 [Candidatus Nomurabacteria bacterium GW2011_GWA1_46_11]|uniref:Uncharacterized protein n=1 Tax=Candidatus Nomurabacteria bacterium GW2011_GWA1_46_11 TaxID=1618732 RepID=A0A0G1NMW1_9BACT|nr:MAG: hypothetical protein UW69_C0004G0016 [Microgenomates group bacterium GW2011_GWA2_44_7]KKT77694.1 MAG: hypothetical protein UW73_C0014G0017 [Microgenomates group bacterium GW2011_GWB1_44_8]KKU21939.1 MAG: hypothetical protein UX31_C0009G0017 [Candidatus Nomurabacteria bacterium GW2011_GWA1_46_11]
MPRAEEDIPHETLAEALSQDLFGLCQMIVERIPVPDSTRLGLLGLKRRIDASGGWPSIRRTLEAQGCTPAVTFLNYVTAHYAEAYSLLEKETALRETSR